MKTFQEWKDNNIEYLPVDENNIEIVDKEDFAKIVLEYISTILSGGMKNYFEHKDANLVEAAETSRYAIDINYRTKSSEALEGFAKICLGYVSAAIKNRGFHTKHVFSEKPLRLLVTTRNWDDGSWCGIVTWNHEHNCFIISKGFYNKDRRTVSVQHSKKCAGDSAAEVSKELVNMMHHVKGQPDKHLEKLKPVLLKRGPKR